MKWCYFWAPVKRCLPVCQTACDPAMKLVLFCFSTSRGFQWVLVCACEIANHELHSKVYILCAPSSFILISVPASCTRIPSSCSHVPCGSVFNCCHFLESSNWQQCPQSKFQLWQGKVYYIELGLQPRHSSPLTPKNALKLLSFLGLQNYYGKFH